MVHIQKKSPHIWRKLKVDQMTKTSYLQTMEIQLVKAQELLLKDLDFYLKRSQKDHILIELMDLISMRVQKMEPQRN
jgi:hypothetical protein